MDGKFFHYFTKLDTYYNMEGFGVLVQIYDNDFTGNLLKIDKQNNRIELGLINILVMRIKSYTNLKPYCKGMLKLVIIQDSS
jgi:hypothetical protein